MTQKVADLLNWKSKDSSKKPKAKAKVKKPQTRTTLLPKSPVYRALVEFLQNDTLATIALYMLAIIMGAFFPVCAYVASHSLTWAWSIPCAVQVLLTVFCLGFSIPTALQFGKIAFDGIKGKACAFGLELAMLSAHPALAAVGLGLLVVVNVLSAFYNLRSGKQFTDIAEKPQTTEQTTKGNALSIAA